MDNYILTLITFLPLLGCVVILCMPKTQERALKIVATAFSLLIFMVCAYLFWAFDKSGAALGVYQFQEVRKWIPAIGVSYHMGTDGLSMPLIVLTGLLTLLSVIYSWIIKVRVKEYFAFFLLLEMGMMGVFCALDFFLFYFFWELSLVPMYFLIGICGGPRREYAAIKFFLYTLTGSVLMLLAMLAMYFNVQPHTLDMVELTRAHPFAGNLLRQSLCFWGLYLAFAIKIPAFPFHTWLPDAHVEAPTAGSVILAGILLKMGTYGLIRVCLPMLPEAAHEGAYIVAVIGVIGIVYGSLVAMAQTDLKKLVAYSSIGHMGFVVLAVGAAAASTGGGSEILQRAQVTALNGATLQMINHGLITGALFFLVGIIYERVHHRDLDKFGGLGSKVPVYSGVLIYMCLASLGLPGLAGFVGEFFCLLGSFAIFKLLTCISVLGVVLCAAYFLWMIQRMLFGPFNERYVDLTDMNGAEIFCLVPLMALTLFIGVYPAFVLGPINIAMQNVLKLMGG